MSWWRRRTRFEGEMDEELQFHIEAYVDDLVRSGVTRAEAERRARLEFGSMETSKEDCRQAWGLRWLDELRADLRLAFRTICHSPGFAAVAVLSLALGIGANTAIFGVYDAVMLRLLPVRDPQQLVFVNLAGAEGKDGPPYPLFELIRDQATSFESVGAFSPSGIEITADRGRELARGVWVSGNFYEMLGVRPVIGRTLTASDDQASGKGGPDGPVAVISRAYWQRRFGGDPAIIGRTVYMYRYAVTIVGVLPSEIMSLEPGSPIDVAVPMAFSDPGKMRDRAALWLIAAARLKPSVQAEQALSEITALFNSYMPGVEVNPETRKRLYQRMDLSPAAHGLNSLRIQFAKPLAALMVLGGLVLLAACVNLTNLMLGRAMARQRDFAVRLAIGAGAGRLVRQNLTESLVLTGAGAALGLLFAQWGQAALLAFFAEGNRTIMLDLALNLRVLLFSVALALVSGVALGIAPALRAAKMDPAAGLHGGSRGAAGNRVSARFGRALVVVQVALSMALLAGAGLFIRSLRQLESVDLGFLREGILTMEVAPERELNGTSEWLTIEEQVLDKVRRIPGVHSAGWATMHPVSGRDRGALVEVPGFVPKTERDKSIHLAAVSPGYFDTLAIPMLVGRGFTARDHASAPKVAILNQTAARFYFADANPIGQRLRFTNYPSRDLIYEVVGIVKDIVHDDMRDEVSRFIYLPIPQSVDRINRLALAVRVSGDPLGFANPVRQQVQEVRSTLLISNVTTIEKQIEQALLRERLVAALSTGFGCAALVLAGIGLYGILAYAVTRRTNEIGIRMALGATRSGVVWLVLRESLLLAAGGVAIGIPVVMLLGRVARASLFGVQPLDPLALSGAAFLLLVFAVIAAALPGRRAALLDPTVALRRE